MDGRYAEGFIAPGGKGMVWHPYPRFPWGFINNWPSWPEMMPISSGSCPSMIVSRICAKVSSPSPRTIISIKGLFLKISVAIG